MYPSLSRKIAIQNNEETDLLINNLIIFSTNSAKIPLD